LSIVIIEHINKDQKRTPQQVDTMKEYKIIKQTGTAVKSQQNFEDLINSYAKMNWTVINMFTHRGILKALIERDKKEEES
jgi:hypothetical protein